MVEPGERKVPAFAMKMVLFRASRSGSPAPRTSWVEELAPQGPREAALQSLWPHLCSPHFHTSAGRELCALGRGGERG